MRNHFIDELYRLAEKDPRIYLLTGDLGFGVLDRFQTSFPDRFINAGISEQNMASVAAGLALEGNIVYMYSIGNFPGMRCLEQIRNDICYNHANVKIIVVGGGFAYGQLGMSHHATEDLAVMRALPGMSVFSPATPEEAVKTLCFANAVDGPCYIRLGKGREPELFQEEEFGDIRRIFPVCEGDKVAVLCTGSVGVEAKKAVETLRRKHISAGLYNVVTVKPLDEGAVRELAGRYELIVTVEEHNVIGGLGSAVAEVLAEVKGSHTFLHRMGLRDVYTSVVGSQDYLRKHYEISAEHIIRCVEELINA